MYWESFSWLTLLNRVDFCYVGSYHLKFSLKNVKDPAKLTIETPNSRFVSNCSKGVIFLKIHPLKAYVHITLKP